MDADPRGAALGQLQRDAAVDPARIAGDERSPGLDLDASRGSAPRAAAKAARVPSRVSLCRPHPRAAHCREGRRARQRGGEVTKPEVFHRFSSSRMLLELVGPIRVVIPYLVAHKIWWVSAREGRMEWTAKAIDHLRALWAEGHSTAEIGRRMGITKNAIV